MKTYFDNRLLIIYPWMGIVTPHFGVKVRYILWGPTPECVTHFGVQFLGKILTAFYFIPILFKMGPYMA
jgi:hypothetical protein